MSAQLTASLYGKTRTRDSFRLVCFIMCLLLGREASAQVVWTLHDSADVSIGDGQTAAHELFRVSDATVLPDGRIAVLNGGTKEVRLYSEVGVHLATFGRDGDGPGEYRILHSIRVLGADTLLVYDPGLSRLTWLSDDGDVLDTRRVSSVFDMDTPMPAPANLRPLRIGVRPFKTGALPVVRLGITMRDFRPRVDHSRSDSINIVVDDGQARRSIYRDEFGETFQTATGGLGLMTPIPFGELLIYAVGPDRVVVGSSHETSFKVLHLDGSLDGQFVAEGQLREPTRRDWAAFEIQFRRENGQALRIGSTDTGDRLPLVERVLEKAPRGEYVPLFDIIILDALGRLWVREYVLEADAASWQVIDKDRGLIARLQMPSSWIVLELGSDYVLAKDRDELGVEFVKRFTIEQRGR